MDIAKLKQIQLGEPIRHGPYTIDRYVAGADLGWIIYSPGSRPFLTRDVYEAWRHITVHDLGNVENVGEF